MLRIQVNCLYPHSYGHTLIDWAGHKFWHSDLPYPECVERKGGPTPPDPDLWERVDSIYLQGCDPRQPSW